MTLNLEAPWLSRNLMVNNELNPFCFEELKNEEEREVERGKEIQRLDDRNARRRLDHRTR